MVALHRLLGPSDMLAYLTMMADGWSSCVGC